MTLHIQIRTNKGGFMAACPSLPGCAAHAQTREEARVKLGDAIAGYLASVNNFVPDNLHSRMVEMQ